MQSDIPRSATNCESVDHRRCRWVGPPTDRVLRYIPCCEIWTFASSDRDQTGTTSNILSNLKGYQHVIAMHISLLPFENKLDRCLFRILKNVGKPECICKFLEIQTRINLKLGRKPGTDWTHFETHKLRKLIGNLCEKSWVVPLNCFPKI